VTRREAEATVVLVRAGVEVARWPLAHDLRPDLALVDALARFQLLARRAGCRIEVREAGGALVALLDLVGLGDVVGDARAALQVDREPEGREEIGVEEAGLGHDPVA
jgi:hypothetical protein